MTRLLERLFPYLRRKGEPPAWRLSPEGAEYVEWERKADVEISVQWRVSPAWLSSAPEYGPGWQATIEPRRGGRKATAVRPTQVAAIQAARSALESRARMRTES
jgi:hypothetical protein